MTFTRHVGEFVNFAEDLYILVGEWVGPVRRNFEELVAGVVPRHKPLLSANPYLILQNSMI